MNFQERDNNIYEKSNDDRISVYLKNIISRYFDIEKEINDETKEAIIIQAYTRLKQFMATYTNNFVVSINEKSGSVSISIQDINGEPAFKKNTAYNKDFCDNDTIEQDTIVRGNDIRLSDSREPLIHIHNINDINGLQEEIDKLDVKLDENRHIHHNKNVLDMLRYTGTNTEIDLVLIEYLIQKCKMAVDGFNDMDDYMVNTAKKYINELMYVTIESKKIIQYIKLNVDSLIDWIQDAKEYTDDNKKNAYEIFISVLNDYLSKDEYNNIANTLKNAVTLFKHGTFSYPERYFMYDTLKNYISNTIKDNSEGDYAYLFEDREGTSVLKTKINDFTINVDTTNLESLLDNTVTVYLTDGSSRTKLPAVIPINKSKHDTLFMTYKLSKNTITVYGYRITELPGLIEQMVPLWAIAEDNAGNKSEYSFMIVPPESKNDYTVCDPKWSTVYPLTHPIQPDNLAYTGSNTDGSISIDMNANISNSTVNISWNSSRVPDGTTYKLYRRSIQNDITGQWEELGSAKEISSSNSEVLNEIYNKSKIIQYYNNNLVTFESDTDKQNEWQVVNGNVSCLNNNNEYQFMLTDDKYEVYKHQVTFTTSMLSYDDDVFAIIISAYKDPSDGSYNNIALMGAKSGSYVSSDGTDLGGKLAIVINHEKAGEQCIATSQMGGDTTGNWTDKTKISFDIRKNRNRVIVYASPIYEADAPDYTKIDTTTPVFSIDLTPYGNNFFNGCVGYGCQSQAYSTFVGINLTNYSTNNFTQFTDTIKDTLPPLKPYISFTDCDAEQLKVKFTPTIQALDSYEANEYRLVVFSKPEMDSNGNITQNKLFDTDVALHINCNSGIKSITYDYNFTPGIMTNRVSQNTGANIDYPRYGIQGDRCYLVSNTSKRFNDVFDANAYLSEYNCRLINDSDNISLMSQELMRANSYIDNLLSENGSCVTYRDNTLKDDEYGDRLAIVFDYGKLSDIFGNSLKVEYNIYNIHGNNPLQAVLNDSTSDTSETQPPLSPTGDPT